MSHPANIIIIGGGLSGLALAEKLERYSIKYTLLEARHTLGGRIETQTVTVGNQSGDFDLGPTWYWPGQPLMQAMVDRFNLKTFEQYSSGNLVFEDEFGTVNRDLNFATMEGSIRLSDGTEALIKKLVSCLDKSKLKLGMRVDEICQNTELGEKALIQVKGENSKGELFAINGTRVVLALPPRLISKISFMPEFSSKLISDLEAIPTWMAGQAKVLAVYKVPFWRKSGLSGDAISRKGPLVEIHDASSNEKGLYALFGFVGVPASVRKNKEESLKSAALDQLAKLFGKEASIPHKLFLKDWAKEAFTATKEDQLPLPEKPSYNQGSNSLENLWDGNLILSSTEMAPNFKGYLEGALEAANLSFEKLKTTSNSQSITVNSKLQA